MDSKGNRVSGPSSCDLPPQRSRAAIMEGMYEPPPELLRLDRADLEALRNLRAMSVPNVDGVIIGKALYAGTVSLPDALARAAL